MNAKYKIFLTVAASVILGACNNINTAENGVIIGKTHTGILDVDIDGDKQPDRTLMAYYPQDTVFINYAKPGDSIHYENMSYRVKGPIKTTYHTNTPIQIHSINGRNLSRIQELNAYNKIRQILGKEKLR